MTITRPRTVRSRFPTRVAANISALLLTMGASPVAPYGLPYALPPEPAAPPPEPEPVKAPTTLAV
ncbi:hypothetical protein [Streptomyces phaeochromogenes]|uniref:hypothetical protein n=1 Tax=Streptomyces phaeochromogenes TaxID=1923 RepID=UPI0033E7CF30